MLPDELENEAALVDERARRKTRMAKSAFEKTLAKMEAEKAKILEENKKEGAKAQPVPDPEYEAALAKAESEALGAKPNPSGGAKQHVPQRNQQSRINVQ